MATQIQTFCIARLDDNQTIHYRVGAERGCFYMPRSRNPRKISDRELRASFARMQAGYDVLWEN